MVDKRGLQEKFCKKNNVPMFAPDYCYCCKKNIWVDITEEEAKSIHITGCPFCNKSFLG